MTSYFAKVVPRFMPLVTPVSHTIEEARFSPSTAPSRRQRGRGRRKHGAGHFSRRLISLHAHVDERAAAFSRRRRRCRCRREGSDDATTPA